MASSTVYIHPSQKIEKDSYAIDYEKLAKELLSPWEATGISQTGLNEISAAPLPCYKNRMGVYEICDNKLYLSGNANPFLARKIKEILKRSKIPNLRFVYYNSPGADFKWGKFLEAPILCQCVNTNISDENFVPFLNRKTDFDQDRALISKINSNLFPWSEKIHKLIWRGGPFSFARVLFQKGAAQFPSFIDAQLVTQKDLTYYLSLEEQLKYKYQMIISGVQGTFPGTFWRLISNSLSFWYDPEVHRTWYSSFLKENEHYISVKSDFSDLIEKIEKARKQDAQSEKIAQAARQFALSNLSVERVEAFAVAFFNRYAELQTFHFNKPSKNSILATEKYLKSLSLDNFPK